jgi:hypothetical protein
VEETYFRGVEGGGGCMGGYFDAPHQLAAIVQHYDTAQEFVETTVVSAPIGVRPGWVPAPTLNGATLGMSLAEVEALEGRGEHFRSRGDVILTYSWKLQNDPQIEYSLKFLLIANRVVAMDFIYGA